MTESSTEGPTGSTDFDDGEEWKKDGTGPQKPQQHQIEPARLRDITKGRIDGSNADLRIDVQENRQTIVDHLLQLVGTQGKGEPFQEAEVALHVLPVDQTDGGEVQHLAIEDRKTVVPFAQAHDREILEMTRLQVVHGNGASSSVDRDSAFQHVDKSQRDHIVPLTVGIQESVTPPVQELPLRQDVHDVEGDPSLAQKVGGPEHQIRAVSVTLDDGPLESLPWLDFVDHDRLLRIGNGGDEGLDIEHCRVDLERLVGGL
jgi:hypothetical protein